MYIDFKRTFRISFLILLGILIGIIGHKIYLENKAPKQTVNIVGYGEVDATTDQASISVVVKNTGKTQNEAQENNKSDVESLKSRLKELGIPESRITVSSYSYPIYDATGVKLDQGQELNIQKMPQGGPVKELTVTSTVTITLDNLKNIEKVYDVIKESVNAQIQSTYYSLGNRKSWEVKARKIALEDARSQVESIAKINKLKVGKLVSISDTNSPGPWTQMYDRSSQGAMELDSVRLEAPQAENSAPSTNVEEKNVYYSEQTVKISASYSAEYELY